MNRYQAIIKKHNDLQLERLDALADDVRILAKGEGISVRFYGSYALRRVHRHSDLDVLIMDELDAPRRNEFIDGIERLASIHQVGVDIVEAGHAPHLGEESIL